MVERTRKRRPEIRDKEETVNSKQLLERVLHRVEVDRVVHTRECEASGADRPAPDARVLAGFRHRSIEIGKRFIEADAQRIRPAGQCFTQNAAGRVGDNRVSFGSATIDP